MKCEYDHLMMRAGEYAFFEFHIHFLLDVANLPAPLRSLFSLASVHSTRGPSLGFSRSFLLFCLCGQHGCIFESSILRKMSDLRRSSSDATSDTSANGHCARSPTLKRGHLWYGISGSIVFSCPFSKLNGYDLDGRGTSNSLKKQLPPICRTIGDTYLGKLTSGSSSIIYQSSCPFQENEVEETWKPGQREYLPIVGSLRLATRILYGFSGEKAHEREKSTCRTTETKESSTGHRRHDIHKQFGRLSPHDGCVLHGRYRAFGICTKQSAQATRRCKNFLPWSSSHCIGLIWFCWHMMM
jgi:hypothetical protein